MLTKTTLTTLMLLFVLAGASAVQGQIIYGQPTAGNLRAVYNSWTLDDDGAETTISQFMIPVTGFVPLDEDFELSFYAANSSNNLEAAGSEYKLSGLSDIRLQVNHSFSEDHLLVSAVVNLPTGKKELNFGEEWQVLQALSTNYLGFPMQRFGEGFGFSLLLGGATMLGENTRGGAGIMYQFVGSYKPYAGFGDYNPGDLISVNAGLDIERGSTIWSLDAIYTMYTEDKVNDISSFKQSPQMDVRLTGRNTGDKISLSGMLRYVLRGDNTIFNETGLELDPIKLYGDEFTAAGALTWAFRQDWYLVPGMDVRTIAGNDIDFDNSTVIGFGAAVGKSLGESLKAEIGYKLYTGSADGGEIDLSGSQITFGLTASM